MPKTPSNSAKDNFHCERSRFLDAFAGLEEALARLPNAARDKRLADELKILRSIRNDLVHSQLRFVQLEGQLQALACNVQEISSVARQGRMFRLDDFNVLSAQINATRQKVESAK
jgi:hypothetical protein